MAAEVLAAELGVDLYRVDLSQVVNKYIGETEKNLRELFDAAERARLHPVLRRGRCAVRQAHRGEGRPRPLRQPRDQLSAASAWSGSRVWRSWPPIDARTSTRPSCVGCAIVIDFPPPGVAERERIWRAGIPPHVDAQALDYRFLARQFVFTGGHIRSVVFNACLQAANAPPETPLPVGKVGRSACATCWSR